MSALGDRAAQRERDDGPFCRTRFSLASSPVPPSYVIRGPVLKIARKQVWVLVADTGRLKSWVMQDAVAASLTRTESMGHSVMAPRVMYVDAENGVELFHDRLRALVAGRDHDPAKVEAACDDRLYLAASKQGDLGDLRVLRERAAEHHTDLLILDTLFALADDNINDGAYAAGRMKALKSLAEELELAVVLMHHDRKKPSQSGPGASVRIDQSQQASGSRQWIGQADGHAWLVDLVGSEEPQGDGTCRQTSSVTLTSGKARRGISGAVDWRVTLSSIEEHDGTLRTASMSGAPLEEAKDDAANELLERALVVLRAARGEGWVTQARLTGKLGVSFRGTEWQRARDEGVETGVLEQRLSESKAIQLRAVDNTPPSY